MNVLTATTMLFVANVAVAIDPRWKPILALPNITSMYDVSLDELLVLNRVMRLRSLAKTFLTLVVAMGLYLNSPLRRPHPRRRCAAKHAARTQVVELGTHIVVAPAIINLAFQCFWWKSLKSLPQWSKKMTKLELNNNNLETFPKAKLPPTLVKWSLQNTLLRSIPASLPQYVNTLYVVQAQLI
ncbi:Aste57867_17355 [Aphanomyces stellatus]|uniref:Aste57867_17355 protein n=1 Tax=Aphanomyces stellatus TaxID=120398 RepID=A0A485L8U7_9STRA|nr:hypothetical protein As57867_017296 [Aphanomyces stellatus]VFT94111.1 Aste57867_17355 [Aphanomyces stellatus]